jgi:hypothetical protein
MDDRKFVNDEIAIEVSQWNNVTGKFKAEVYPGTPPLDTTALIVIDFLTITWNDRQKFMEELAELVKKYQI